MADRVPFTGYPLDRADTVRKSPEALGTHATATTTRVLVFWRGKPLLHDVEGGWAPAWQPATTLEHGPRRLFLGLNADGQACFALDHEGDEPAPRYPGADWRDVRGSAVGLDFDAAALVATARSVFEWHRTHRFCAACGTATQPTQGGWRRDCPACEREHFPRVDPVVIALIVHDDRVLLGRAPHWPPGMYSCLAGFVEPGETLGDATRREAMEEAGIELGDVSYRFGQPWPFPSSLMLGVRAEALSTDIHVDGVELSEARWFTRADIRAMLDGAHAELMVPPRIAIATHLLIDWLTT